MKIGNYVEVTFKLGPYGEHHEFHRYGKIVDYTNMNNSSPFKYKIRLFDSFCRSYTYTASDFELKVLTDEAAMLYKLEYN